MNKFLLPAVPFCLLLTGGMPARLTAQPLPSERPAPATTGPVVRSSPSQLYLQGHLVMKDGTELEAKGDFAGAYFKFKDARDLFDSAAEADRTWQPEVVEYRRRKIREEMERVRQLEIQRRAAGGAPSPSGVVGSASTTDITIEPAQPANSAAEPPRNTAVVIEERMRGMQTRIEELSRKNEEVVKQLGAREEELRGVKSQMLEARNTENSLRESLAKAQTDLERAEPAAKRKNETLTKRVEQLESQLGDAMAQLATANTRTDSLLSDLEKAYTEIKERTRERDEIRQERDQMEALLAGGGEGKAPEKLKIIAENQRLKKELETAQANIARLTADKDSDRKEIASLRGQLEEVRQQVLQFQAESEDYRQQIVALTERLDATNKRLAETGEGAVTEVEASLENRVLREIILQQMKQQAKRESARRNIMEDLAREGVLESMKNLGVETDRVLRSLNEMAAAPDLTKEQRGTLANPNLAQFLLKNGVGDLMMVQDSQELRASAAANGENPGSTGETRTKEELTPELKAYANAAEEQFRQGAYPEAENQYRKILMLEPMNVHALRNLGVVLVNKHDYSEAEKTIKKALAYDYDSGPVHYLLGVVYMRQNRLDDAVDEIKEGLKLDDKNANAYLTLGLIALKTKNLGEAESYLKQTIALDPSCAQAHFNLAMIYAKDSKLGLARQHYRLALRNGASPDRDLDNLLNS